MTIWATNAKLSETSLNTSPHATTESGANFTFLGELESVRIIEGKA